MTEMSIGRHGMQVEGTHRALSSLNMAKPIRDYVNSIYLTVHLREEGTASEKRLHLFYCRHR